MANNILKSLGIDGEVLDILYPSNISITIPTRALAANTVYKSDSINLDKGIHVAYLRATFAAATSTGAVNRRMGCFLNGAINYTFSDLYYDAIQEGAYRTAAFIINMTSPGSFEFGFNSNKASVNGSYFSGNVIKISDTPWGGVIRRLLNALKPLSFRLERGCV